MLYKFLLFEGVDGSGKTSLAKMLSEKIGGLYYHSPPTILESLKPYANQATPEIRFHYFLLANYIISQELPSLLLKQHVVMDKYIYSTIAFHSVLLNQDLAIPTDLLMPDQTFYLTVSPEILKERLMTREKVTKYETIPFLQKVDKKYEQLFEAQNNITRIDTTNKTPEDTLAHIEKELRF